MRDCHFIWYMKFAIRRTLIVLLILLLPVLIALWIILPTIILRPQKIDITQHPELLHHKVHPEDYGLKGQDISFNTTDSVHIAATFIPSNIQPARATIIMLHGIGACKEIFLPRAAQYNRDSLNVILMDNRAHGQSGGEYCTYGYHEKQDVSELITEIQQRDSTTPIGIYGASLGGAIAWQVIGHDDRIRFAIIESTFDDLRNVVREYLARFIGFHFNALADFALWRATQVAEFNSDEVVPMNSAAHASCPVFCAHGTKDIHIPMQFGLNNYARLNARGSEIHLIPSADHNNLSAVGGKKYYSQMSDFIRKNTPQIGSKKNDIIE